MKSISYNSLKNKIITIKFYPLLVSFVFFLFIIMGLFLTPDFGISVDEPIQRQHRLINFKQIMSTVKIDNTLPHHFKKLPNLQDYPHRFYGVATQLPLILMEYHPFFSYQNRVYWYISHYFNHGMFLLSGVFLYKGLLKLKVNKYLSLLMTVSYLLHPRIYANSFYNIKDSLFLSMFTINTYFLIQVISKTSYKNIIFLSIFSAFLTNIRLVGAFIPLIATVYIFIINRAKIKNKVNLFLVLSVLSISTFFIITPVLWENTFDNLITLIGLSSNYNRWNGPLIFNGNIIMGSDIPFYYLPVWISITTPIGYLVVWFLSITFSPLVIQDKNYSLNKRLISLFSLLIIGISYSLILIFKSRLYGDWRHIYYIHTSLTIIAAVFLDYLYYHKLKVAISGLLITISLSLLLTLNWMYLNHPHYYVYFNKFASKKWDEKWDRDIWRLSTKQAMELILKDNINNKEPTYIFNNPNVNRNAWIIPGKLRANLKLTKYKEESDYIILDYRAQPGEYSKVQLDNFVLYKSINVDNKPISAIFIKKDLLE